MPEEATQDEPMVTNYCRMCEAAARRIKAFEAENARLREEVLVMRTQDVARQALGETQ